KSISHGAVLFGSIAAGESRIESYSPAADPQSTVSCLAQLGVEIARNGDTVTIGGRGRSGLTASPDALDCGNSGTTMRLLTGILAGAGVDAKLTGDPSLNARTMKRIIDPLKQMGSHISG